MTADFSQMTALVVDDNSALRDFLKGYLFELGMGIVKTARNGEQALDVLHKCRVDLILSDAVMPGIDGITLLERIKGGTSYSDIPFIMISGFPDKVAIPAVIGGACDFIVKPFTFETFSAKVNAVLRTPKRVIAVPSVKAASADKNESPPEPCPVTNELAKSSASVDAILDAYGAKRSSGTVHIEGVKGSQMVAVRAEGVVSRKRIDDVIKECIEKKFARVTVLGRVFESGLFPSAQQYAGSRGINLELKYIPELADSPSSGVQQFQPVPSLQVQATRKMNTVIIELLHFSLCQGLEGLKADGKPRLPVVYQDWNQETKVATTGSGEPAPSWSKWVSAWAVEIARGHASEFTACWTSVGRQPLPTQSSELELYPGSATIRVCVVDVLGNSTIRTITVDPEQ